MTIFSNSTPTEQSVPQSSSPCPHACTSLSSRQNWGTTWQRSRQSRKSPKVRLQTFSKTAILPQSEKKWAEKTLAPTLEKSPERPIGAPTGVNLDEHGHARFTTISGVPIRRLYTEADLPKDWSEEKYLGYPGQPPLHARHSRHRISRQALHHAPVLRFRLAGRNQPALQISAGARRQRTFRGLRSAHADGLRLRPSRQRRRSRQMRRRYRFARRHGNSLRRHRSRKDHGLDDHQFARVGAVGYVSGGRGKARR